MYGSMTSVAASDVQPYLRFYNTGASYVKEIAKPVDGCSCKVTNELYVRTSMRSSTWRSVIVL